MCSRTICQICAIRWCIFSTYPTTNCWSHASLASWKKDFLKFPETSAHLPGHVLKFLCVLLCVLHELQCILQNKDLPLAATAKGVKDRGIRANLPLCNPLSICFSGPLFPPCRRKSLLERDGSRLFVPLLQPMSHW